MTTLRIQVISIPSFLVLGVAFLISGSISLFYHKAWHIPLKTLLIGSGGIFGYHFLYFMAFTFAPAVEVNLINYLWPVLIVALTPLVLSGYKLHLHHLLGVGLGLIGAGLIVTGGSFHPQVSYFPGYLLALGAAFTWALYSLLTKRLPTFDSSAVSVFTFISGILSLLFYFVSGGSIGQFTQLTGREWLICDINRYRTFGWSILFMGLCIKARRSSHDRFIGFFDTITFHVDFDPFWGRTFDHIQCYRIGADHWWGCYWINKGTGYCYFPHGKPRFY